ncbi:MAG: zinc-binding dehydrogenase [Promethearchaeota archaeon]
MKSAYFEQHGKLDQITVGDLPVPSISPEEVLIKTQFGAINHLDLFVLLGWPSLDLKLPHIMGSDGSGIISTVGEKVKGLKKGDRVTINPGIGCGKCDFCMGGEQSLCNQFQILGEHRDGTFAEYFKISSQNVLRIPDTMPFDLAAAAPLTFLTAWRMLVSKANVRPGEFVLVQGASGGVSIAAIQIAKLFGAKVIATTSSAEKMEKTYKIGADVVINYNETPNYAKSIFKEHTQKHGIDVAVDSVGQATFPTSVKLLHKGGRLVTCGATTGPKTEIDIRQIFWKQISLIGSTMSNHQEFTQVMQLIFEGKLKPQIDSDFSLENVKEAEEYLKKGTQFGKVLIKIQ